jgi:hypothetical protein
MSFHTIISVLSTSSEPDGEGISGRNEKIWVRNLPVSSSSGILVLGYSPMIQCEVCPPQKFRKERKEGQSHAHAHE